ncbi:MAG: 50S ribosomal protein L30 [Deltaproteobacteria bacterium]|nr:50S ribosomal protein L30 [Deltaproteobacteria bacterium]
MKEGLKVKVRQIRSAAGRMKQVGATLSALGLGRIGREREHVINAPIWGMLRRVRHLIRVTESQSAAEN